MRNPLRRDRRQIEVRPAPPGAPTTACCAPQVQVDFRPSGDVQVCCRNAVPLGNVRTDRFADMWAGSRRQEVVAALARHDFGAGCGHCGAEVAAEGRPGSYPAQFDVHLPALAAGGSVWPRHMEFTLSINCNLQCGQCSGELSSAIRVHREGRAPLPPAELHPDLPVTIVTNATQWTPRVQSLLDRLRCSFRLSIDGVSPATYESIRVGASFERMRTNVDRFVEYGRRRGTDVGINHCLMRQNAHEFLDLLRWADGLDVPVFVSVVRNDTRLATGGELFSIVRSPSEEIRGIADLLGAQDAEAQRVLGRNLGVWDDELHRVRSWAAVSEDERRRLLGVSGATVLVFSQLGDGPTDTTGARRELAAVAVDGQLHEVRWGPGEVVVDLSPSLDDLVGARTAASLTGAGPREFVEGLESALGPMGDYRVTSETPDRVDAVASFERATVRVVMMPLRNDEGWADTALQLLALVPSTPVGLGTA